VGSDSFGRELKTRLDGEGVDTRWVREAPGTSTGVAAITVCKADNAIIVVPGANASLGAADLDAAEAEFSRSDVVIAQLEVPLATVAHAADLASRHGKPFILNPAPAMALPESLLARCTLITPNEFELSQAIGVARDRWRESVTRMPGRIVMTKGKEGAYFSDAAGVLRHQPGFPVTPIDTTGAGDTFNGALAAFWSMGIEEAVRRGCAASALKIGKAGAQEGMPRLQELDTFLAHAR
jgi:ribokinase